MGLQAAVTTWNADTTSLTAEKAQLITDTAAVATDNTNITTTNTAITATDDPAIVAALQAMQVAGAPPIAGVIPAVAPATGYLVFVLDPTSAAGFDVYQGVVPTS